MTAAFRIAMRAEGDRWTAYYAKPDTMDGALWLASIRLSLVDNPENKQAFIDLLTTALAKLVPANIERWTQQQAPESERSGSA